MQTLPLTIWGSTPTEGTPAQAAQVEAGFEGILAETLPQSELKTVEILGEDGLEAGSIGPIALDQKLDQAADSQTSSDLIALVMSLGQPTAATAQNETQLAAAEFAVISAASAIPTADKAPAERAAQTSKTDTDLLAKKLTRTVVSAPTREAATAAAPETAARQINPVEAPTAPAGFAWQSSEAAGPVVSTPIDPQPTTGTPSSVWSVEAAKAVTTPQPTATESGKVDSQKVREPSTDSQGTHEDIENPVTTSTEGSRVSKKISTSASTVQTSDAAPAPAAASEASSRTASAPSTKEAAAPETQPTQTQTQTQTPAQPVAVHAEDTVTSSQVDLQSREAKPAAQLNAKAEPQAAAEAVVQAPQSPEARQAPQVSQSPEAKQASQAPQSPEAKQTPQASQSPEATQSSQAKSKNDLPSFVHQTDPVSQMLTDRWVAWVKQNYQGADAPKISSQASIALPASLNTAFNVTIQDGQVHLDLPKPVAETIEPALQSLAAAAVKTITSLVAGSEEETVQVETAAPIQIDPAAVTANPIAKKAMAGSARAEKAPQEGTSEEDAEVMAESESAPKQITDEPVKARVAAPVKEAVNPAIKQAVEQSAKAVLGAISLEDSPAETWSPSQVSKDSDLPQTEAPETASANQTIQAASPNKTAPASPTLTPEKQEQAVAQTKETLQNLVAAGRNQVTTIRLNPDDLGSLTITIKKTGRKVEAEISASMESVRQALTSQKHELAQAVESKGALLTQLVVKSEASADTSSNSQFAQNGQASDGQAQKESHQEAARFSRLAASHSSTSSEAPVSTQTGRARRTSRFDLTA